MGNILLQTELRILYIVHCNASLILFVLSASPASSVKSVTKILVSQSDKMSCNTCVMFYTFQRIFRQLGNFLFSLTFANCSVHLEHGGAVLNIFIEF